MAMMRQAGKVELFKKSRSRTDALHAKYSISECSAFHRSPSSPSSFLSHSFLLSHSLFTN